MQRRLSYQFCTFLNFTFARRCSWFRSSQDARSIALKTSCLVFSAWHNKKKEHARLLQMMQEAGLVTSSDSKDATSFLFSVGLCATRN
jgi:hypothetical protein